MSISHEILRKYWGFDSFREKQEEIIDSVLQGRDTLALLPTGGGKSICFQVPAMVKDGVCIVVSPLIALMKDQVENLKKRGISAVAISSGMRYSEIDIALDNCVNGHYKFLYCSPERLETELFQARVKRMKVSFLVVDEAHCISEWGFDFRPSYLRIADLRELLPKISVLALTATAIPRVVTDLQDKLAFQQHHVISKSFERSNLTYVVVEEENKLQRLVRLIQRLKGSGIVYGTTRRQVKDIAQFLQNQQISAAFYHGGVPIEDRDKIQVNWVQNKIQVICATNAFGMGIDKPDVRFVVHLSLPSSVEAYFQEAGRAGRDEQSAYAVVFYAQHDVLQLEEQLKIGFPEIDEIKRVYKALGNFYQIANGSALGESFPFDLKKFAKQYNIAPLSAYNALKFLERDHYISLSQNAFLPSRIHFKVNHKELYSFKIKSPTLAPIIDLILRSYTRYFDEFIVINESILAQRAQTSRIKIVKALSHLHQLNILEYVPQSDLPLLTFTREKVPQTSVIISKEVYQERKKIATERTQAMIDYVTNHKVCRSIQLLNYFGEKIEKTCGKCDVCLAKKKSQQSEAKIETMAATILTFLETNSYETRDLIDQFKTSEEQEVLKAIHFLVDTQQAQLENDVLSKL